MPIAEAVDRADLAAEAAAISPAAAQLVASKGGWNPLAKSALVEGGAATSAKYLNLTGISAEYAPELQLGIALASIFGGRMMLLQEIRALAREQGPAIDVPAKVEVQRGSNQ